MTIATPRMVHLTETTSTNADALRLALAGEALPLWVSADRQTAGRGRAGRTWISEPGNLHASLAVLIEAPLQQAGELSLVAGVALFDAIGAATSLGSHAPMRLKWPNDVLIAAAKVGGILVETATARGKSGYIAVLGFGVNVAKRPGTLAAKAMALADISVNSITPSPSSLLEALVEQCSLWLAQWDAGRNFATIRNAWMERAGPIGETVTVNTTAGRRSATYQGLASNGALLVDIDGRQETIGYGDVSLVTRADEETG